MQGTGGSNKPSGASVQWVTKDEVFSWKEDVLLQIGDLLPQEEGMTYMNVPPAPGVTPAGAAKSLRLLIKNSIWPQLDFVDGGNNAANRQAALSHLDHLQSHLKTLDEELTFLVELAKLRRPNETRVAVANIRAGSLSRLRYYHRHAHGQIKNIKVTGSAAHLGELRKSVTEAYSLIQALPTIDKPTTGKAENTIRAITAILKVHYGLDVGASETMLPDIMATLLKEIASAKAPVEEKEIVLDEEEGLVMLNPLPVPYKIWNDAGNYQFTPNDFYINLGSIVAPHFGAPAWDADFLASLSTDGWSEGKCSYKTALDVFMACRARYSGGPFSLRQGEVVIAYADQATPIVILVGEDGATAQPVEQSDNVIVFAPPFYMHGGSNALSKWAYDIVTSIITTGASENGQAQDGPGSNQLWKKGLCTVPEAMLTLIHARRRWATTRISLRDSNNALVGRAQKGQPIEWSESAKPWANFVRNWLPGEDIPLLTIDEATDLYHASIQSPILNS